LIELPLRDPGTPDVRSPVRLLVWVGRHQIATLLAGVGFGVTWMLAQALMPFAIGRAIQDGIDDRLFVVRPLRGHGFLHMHHRF